MCRKLMDVLQSWGRSNLLEFYPLVINIMHADAPLTGPEGRAKVAGQRRALKLWRKFERSWPSPRGELLR